MYETELLQACNPPNIEKIRLIITNVTNFNVQNEDGSTPLMLCAAGGCKEGVLLILQMGADPTLYNSEGWDALRIAKECDSIEIIPILVIANAKKLKFMESDNDPLEIILCKLITTLLYESKRHQWDLYPCSVIREYLGLLHWPYQNYTKTEFSAEIRRIETQTHTFYGSYLSDDSDDEDEANFLSQSPQIRHEKFKKYEAMTVKAQVKKITYTNNTKTNNSGDLRLKESKELLGSELFNLPERIKLPDRKLLDPVYRIKIEQDLIALNTIFSRYKDSPERFKEELVKISTQFVVAQYRGVTYLTARWNKPERVIHRNKNEINLPLYSHAVHSALGVGPSKLTEHLAADEETAQLIMKIVTTIKQILLSLRENTSSAYKEYAFLTLSDLLHNLYSNAYDEFHQLISEDGYLKQILYNQENPYVSTGDVPYHALKYAFGIKPYVGHEEERLRPRWQRNGKAERPYSGKVYVLLHPVTDYLESEGVAHITSMMWQGNINIKMRIAPERETSFLAAIPKDRVVAQFKAKYPSFTGSYKNIYLEKYGLEETLYYKFQHALYNTAPHTEEHTSFKKLLGEWLCSFYEVKLIEAAYELAADKVLVYRNEFGLFSLIPPEQAYPLHNSVNPQYSTPIKARNGLRKQISPGSSAVVKVQLPLSLQPINIKWNGGDPVNTDEDFNGSPQLIPAILLNVVKYNYTFALAHFLSKPEISNFINNIFNDVFLLENAHLLHIAIYFGYHDMVRTLLDFPSIKINTRADETTYDIWRDQRLYLENLTPFLYAIVCNKIEIVTLFLKNPNTDKSACANGVDNKDKMYDCAYYDKEEGDDLDAFLKTNPEMIGGFLIGTDGYTVVRTKNWSALHLAVQFAEPEVLKLLIDAGVSLNIMDSDGYTALRLATLLKKEEHVALLSAAQTDTDEITNLLGRTTLAPRPQKMGDSNPYLGE